MQKTDLSAIIDKQLLDELPIFETFFKKIGFKRIEGAIYGLLVLADKGLSSEEIEHALNLSQSAVSQALKNLTHFGAIETYNDRESRVKIHTAKADSLSIVATIFRKREQEMIVEFKSMAKRLLAKEKHPGGLRSQKLQSIVQTCDMAELVMNFVMQMAQHPLSDRNQDLLNKFTTTMELLSKGIDPIGNKAIEVAQDIKSKMGHKLKEGLWRVIGE